MAVRSAGRNHSALAALVLLATVVASCSSSDAPAATPTTSAGATSELAGKGAQGSTAATSPATTASPADGGFPVPVAVSEDHRYLVDQHGQPYMVIGDSPQCLPANLSVDDMEYFFANRESHGFNVLWVNLICGPYTFGRPDGATYDGIAPFLRDDDVSMPNPAYWSRMDQMVQLAAKHRITLIMDPAETGSFRGLLANSGEDESKAYGEFLGKRYKSATNIVWMLGNDYQIDQWPASDPYEVALSKGLRAGDPTKLQTIELNPNKSTSYDNPTWPPLIDFATAYTYEPTYDAVLETYHASPTQPVLMIEANYEEENNDGGPTTTDVTMRRQEWWTLTSGATGQLYGNKHTWGLQDADWKDHFDTPAVTQLGLMVKLIAGRAWQDLVPDESHSFLVDGSGTYANGGDVLDSDYATAATTPDGTLGLVYVPTARTIKVDMTKMKPGARARWFDPTDGSFRDAPTGETPGKNAAGDDDWVLVVDMPGA